uniref:Uncharacterized protein n=1 Tax=Ciona intestinalis TaxID=7719 RepID=F6ZKQ1_CIOIN
MLGVKHCKYICCGQTLGSDHLSQNLASNESFTPLQQDRFTVSPDRYEEYRSTVKKQARAPWGRLRDYGGMQKIQLPEEFIKLKGYPPVVVQKGHRHYGTGASDSRYLPIPQYYDVTDLKKSNVRTSDQVLPSSPDKQMSMIDLPFPAEHPHSSHIERFALFPCFKSPDDRTNGDPIRGQTPLHANAASSAHKFAVVANAGAAFRREIQEYPQASKKEPLVWNSEDNIYQLKKTPISGRQAFYPTPPKMVHPNTRLRSEEQTLELRSVNCLRNIERDQWKTTYDYNYTGNGPSNVMHIDDYHKKMINAIESGSDTVDNELMPLTTPIFLPSRPVEGRYARMYQNRRELKADIRYPDEHSADTTLDVVDNRDYLSLPATPNSIRRIDEWYKTGRNTSDPVVERTEKVEELVNLPEETKYYLKDYQEERDIKFKFSTEKISDIGSLTDLHNRKHQVLHREPDPPHCQKNKGLYFKNTESTLKRPSTPLPTPHRPIREPSVYSALRPSTSDSFAHVKTSPRDSWKWNFDTRVSAEFKPIWRSQPGTPYTQSSLMDIQNNWSKSDAHRRLHESLPETAPDLSSIKHREKRHKFYGFHSYHFYN